MDTTGGGGGTTQFRFNATTKGGIALANGTSYWLVLAFVDGSYCELQGSTVPYDGAPIGGLVGLGGRVVVEPQQGGWVDSNEVVALSIDIFGCLQPSPSPTPTRSPSSSPSTSPSRPTSITGQVKAIVNTTATFSDEGPAVSITGSLPESSSAVAVELGVAGLLLGDVAVDFEALNTTRMGTTSGPSSTTAYAYSTQIEASTLTQSFSHFHQATPMSFAGLNFTARDGTANFTAAVDTTNHSLTSNAQRNGFTIRYRVSDLSTLRSPTAEQRIFRRDDTPQAGITTFYVALPKTSGGSVDDAVAQLEVLGVALVDDAVVPLTHMSLAVATESADVAGANNGSYVLELGFPPFTQFVVYDPSLGLGVLIGRPGGDGSSPSSSDLGLILGVAVAVPLAVLFVLAVIVASLVAVRWFQWRRNRNRATAVNFGEAPTQADPRDLL
jgi:hypothetical protein